ncbi:hypothetical protein JCM21714_273 [Gracilibacillus boraciitolerans JCM 21714]|uniref:Uncharacterized protein n=1 Tax=Gracilibacillus boraciitolerans JCM 21714 TaxID=1298598 RepID=W4VD40_9BACI|nr:hypothetical protein JCM21714_273 [Gracilibacillus boraciitolerans JCM 21714]
MLAAICVIGRIGFQFLPNIQPVTTIIIITSAMLGVFPGISIAIISTYLTNLFLGMGDLDNMANDWLVIHCTIIRIIRKKTNKQ